MWVSEFLGLSLEHQDCLCKHLENPGCPKAREHLRMQNVVSQDPQRPVSPIPSLHRAQRESGPCLRS